MKLLKKITSLIGNRNKKKIVLIKSKFGLAAVRVCGAVLVDGGGSGQGGGCSTGDSSGPCIGAMAGGPNGSCPCQGLYNTRGGDGPICPPDLGGGCTNFNGTAPVYWKNYGFNDNFSRILFKGHDVEYKESISNLDGLDSVFFGNVTIKNKNDEDCMLVQFDIKIINPIILIKMYNFTLQETKQIFFKTEQEKKYYENLLNGSNIVMPLVEFEDLKF